ncbi:MAG: helix-turn-helix transcriptional regulator [Pseudomonadota bacterium]
MARKKTYKTILQQRESLHLVQNHLDKHFESPLQLNDIADISGFNPYHFQRLFSDTLGETWREYVLRHRINKASQQLLSTPEKIVDIAHACGFETHAGFNKAFSQLVSTTPSKYRDQFTGEKPKPLIPRKKRRSSSITPQVRCLSEPKGFCVKNSNLSYSSLDLSVWAGLLQLMQTLEAYPEVKHQVKKWCVSVNVNNFLQKQPGHSKVVAMVQSNYPSKKHLVFETIAFKGLYAVFRHQGALSEQSVQCIIYDWLPFSDFTICYDRSIFFQPVNLSLLQISTMIKNSHLENNQLMYQGMKMKLCQIENILVDVYIPIKPQYISHLEH